MSAVSKDETSRPERWCQVCSWRIFDGPTSLDIERYERFICGECDKYPNRWATGENNARET